jgi:serine/threonine-protein kinase HipA
MNRCLITYEEIPPGTRYSSAGLRILSRRLKGLQVLPYSAEQQRHEAVARASKMSIQGMQPKLSSRLNVVEGIFEIVDSGGEFILKPQTDFLEVPENEDVTMRLAASIGIDIPIHGLLRSKDDSLTYFIKRFDRAGQGKIAVEDFAQLSGKTRDTKYDSSMEQIVRIIDTHCTFPSVEKVKLFKLTLFNYLVGNEDMHLKNFSLVRRDDKIELSPAYDLVNTTIALRGVQEEIALSIDGRKRNLSRSLLVGYFGKERLGLADRVIDDVLARLESAVGEWERVIKMSFLTETAKTDYNNLLLKRSTILLTKA